VNHAPGVVEGFIESERNLGSSCKPNIQQERNFCSLVEVKEQKLHFFKCEFKHLSHVWAPTVPSPARQ
jgi:hypothetical protein